MMTNGKPGFHRSRALNAATLVLLLAAAGTHASAQTVKIAGSIDRSGPLSALGSETLSGFEFAVKALNAKGGVLGRQVELEIQDNGSNPARAVNQATALAQPDVAMLLSPISSASTLAVSKTVSAKMKIPLCVSVSAAEEITMKDYQPYVISTAPTTYMLMQAVTARLAKRHYRRYAMLVPDYAGGRAAAVRFRELMKQLDPKAEIVVEEYPKLGATDYTASINKILAAKPDYVWSQLLSNDLLTFSKQAKAIGFFDQIDNHFMVVLDTTTLKALGDNAPFGAEAYQYAPFNAVMNTPDGKVFVAGYKAETGRYPSDWVIAGYDCLMSWSQAATQAKSFAADDVIHALETGTFSSLRGPIHFGAFDHEADVPIYFGKLAASKEFGQPVLDVDEIVPGAAVRPSREQVESSRRE